MRYEKMMLKKRNSLPTWDLSDLYTSESDPAIERDLKRARQQAQRFNDAYRGTLVKHQATPATLKKILHEYEAILMILSELQRYAFLEFSIASTEPIKGAFLDRINAQTRDISRWLTFFELELGRIPVTIFKTLANHAELTQYRKYLLKQLARRPHHLSEKEEQIFNDLSLTGGEAFARFFEQETAGRLYTLRRTGRKRELSLTEVLTMQKDADRAVRKEGAQALSTGLKTSLTTAVYIYNTLAADKAIRDRYHGFASPEHAQHIENETTQAEVDAMAKAVVDGYGICHDLYTFKRHVLGYKKLYEYDRYAPVTAATKKFSWAEAQDIVLSSFGSFSPQYASVAKLFFDKHWIHAEPQSGKQGGAYCCYVTPRRHPYILLNYAGTLDDVNTLAHELGHAVQAYLARQQSFLHFDWPLTVAETASVFGEMLVFDYLKTILGTHDSFALVMAKLDSIAATVYRQVTMYRFEQDVHERRKQGELLPEDFNRLWQQRMQEMFGDSLTLTDNHAVWWSYVPHVIRTPFYVYSYAFGELLTLALYEHYRQGDPDFPARYMALLAKGGSEFPQALLEPLGISLAKPDFWQRGIQLIAGLLAEAKELHTKL